MKNRRSYINLTTTKADDISMPYSLDLVHNTPYVTPNFGHLHTQAKYPHPGEIKKCRSLFLFACCPSLEEIKKLVWL